MKRFAVIGTVVVAVVLGSIGVARAGDSATVAVSASVSGNCKFVASGGLAFGILDPAVGADVAGIPSQPVFWCTKGTAFTIADDFGVNEASAGIAPRLMSNGLDTIPYTFTYTAVGIGAGAGPANHITMDIAGGVLGVNYANVSAGAYTDTVTLTVAP